MGEVHEPLTGVVEAGQWVVYLLRCADGTLYAGVSSDLSRRLRQHNGDIKGGAQYTRSRRPVELLVAFACENRSEAQRQEAAIRKLSRREKLSLPRRGLPALPAA